MGKVQVNRARLLRLSVFFVAWVTSALLRLVWRCTVLSKSVMARGRDMPDCSVGMKEENGFKIAYIIFPGTKDDAGNFKSGTLEDLCLESLSDVNKNKMRWLRLSTRKSTKYITIFSVIGHFDRLNDRRL